MLILTFEYSNKERRGTQWRRSLLIWSRFMQSNVAKLHVGGQCLVKSLIFDDVWTSVALAGVQGGAVGLKVDLSILI